MTNRILVAALALLPLVIGSVPAAVAVAAEPAPPASTDVVARVGDQAITFAEVNTMLNSSAVVGLSIPALGTPERDTVRITLLDKFISANLFYLDALEKGVDKDPAYRRDLSRFSDAILAGRYWDRQMAKQADVSEEQIEAAFKAKAGPDDKLTDDVRLRIASRLRKSQRKLQMADVQQALRDAVEVKVFEENLTIDGDAGRADDTPLALVGGEPLTWGGIKDKIIGAGKGAVMADPLASEDVARRAALEREIVLRIAVRKAREEGLESDPLVQRRLSEFRKSRLINRHRDQLLKEIEPSAEELEAYYEANRSRFVLPETRKLQMVVVKTEQEARELKTKIDAGEMTLYQAALDHSIAAHAKDNLGEVGWVNQGELAPALDELVFTLGPGDIGGPVETPAGWHLVLVQDVKDAEFTDIGAEATRRLVRRRYLDEQLAEYTVALRTDGVFPVEVYEDRLVQLAQQEADMVKELAEKADQPESVTQERIKELQKYLEPGR